MRNGQGGDSSRMTRSSVTIQITPESKPSTPSWMGEVAAFAQVLTHTGILKAIQFPGALHPRARMPHYDLIDFVVVLIGSGLSGEPTLHAFYEQLAPFAEPFMALDAAKPVAPSLDPFSLSGRSRSGKCGGAPQAFSRGSACAKTVCFSWWFIRPDGSTEAGGRCGWNEASRPKTWRCRRRKPCLLLIGDEEQVCAPG